MDALLARQMALYSNVVDKIVIVTEWIAYARQSLILMLPLRRSILYCMFMRFCSTCLSLLGRKIPSENIRYPSRSTQ